VARTPSPRGPDSFAYTEQPLAVSVYGSEAAFGSEVSAGAEAASEKAASETVSENAMESEMEELMAQVAYY